MALLGRSYKSLPFYELNFDNEFTTYFEFTIISNDLYL